MALSKKQVESFKDRLLQLRQQLTTNLSEAKKDVVEVEEPKGYSQHQADEGTDDFNRTVGLEITNRESGVLRQVERALEKIDDGSYGVCDLSGEEIPIKRLDAIPYATMTVKAQEMLEKESL